ncbi:hypothetical protein [Nocardiopsis sp. MG754419]|uniref:hypothetical protein n=1 Tax=Nocardiopsis sp. MG754419 TaxID=2259865 RepID=UPI001BA91CC6|nr:hypothetical protein [Nocardiopsis sp. MG754419]MBR8742243.1 hypothetical protein [Nocardiopsis sp. MG754419]
MSGYHGTVGATGVRPAVCPEPLRRALLLAGLVTGILFTVWLSSAPAQADDLALTASALPRTGAVAGDSEVLGAVGGTVATVGEQATRAVDGASQAARTVEAETDDPVRHVREAVESAPLPDPEGISASLAPVTDQVVDPASEDAEAADEKGVSTDEAESPEVFEVETPSVSPEHGPLHERAVSTPDQGSDATETDDDRRVLGSDGRDGSVSGGATPATAPATGGTATAPAVAGYLTAAAAPAPAPGLVEAARHVLRSVPAESTDEPTFSPD